MVFDFVLSCWFWCWVRFLSINPKRRLFPLYCLLSQCLKQAISRSWRWRPTRRDSVSWRISRNKKNNNNNNIAFEEGASILLAQRVWFPLRLCVYFSFCIFANEKFVSNGINITRRPSVKTRRDRFGWTMGIITWLSRWQKIILHSQYTNSLLKFW